MTTKTGKGECKHLTKPSQRIKDRTGNGEDYIDSYLYCTTLQKRITKKHCKNCTFYEKFTFPN